MILTNLFSATPEIQRKTANLFERITFYEQTAFFQTLKSLNRQ